MNRSKKLKLFILMLALICAIAVGAHAQEPDQLYRVDEIPIEDLSEILPARNVRDPLVYEFLPGNRLFAVTDRLNLIDLNAMKRIAEAPLPDSAPALDSEKLIRFDRVEALENGFAWIVSIATPAEPHLKGTYYQFDNQLNVIREVNLNDYMPSPDMVYLDISRDGSEIYIIEHSLMRRINLDSSDEKILLETKMGFGMDLNSIGSLRLIDNGKTVLFSGDKFLSVEEGGSHINTVRVYGSMSPDGENRVLTDAPDFNVEIITDAYSPLHLHTPQTSPIALIVPYFTGEYDSETKMIKTVYALDVAAKHVVEIPLQAPTEEERAKLSENGKYLATAVCESRDDGTFALVPRLYGAAKGSLLATYEFPALSDCTNAAVGVSEEDGLISVVYQDGQAVRLVRIPIEK